MIALITGSVGRRGIVSRAGLPWLVTAPDFDEESAKVTAGKAYVAALAAAAEYAAELARLKCEGAVKHFAGREDGAPDKTPDIIITADTVVFCDKLLEKPKTEAEVYEMIGALNNRAHYVVTAVSISGAYFHAEAGKSKFGNDIIPYGKNTFAAVSTVALSGVPREAVARMIAEENPYRFAGGYTIDGMLAPYFSVLAGTEENVIGLPLSEILDFIKIPYRAKP